MFIKIRSCKLTCIQGFKNVLVDLKEINQLINISLMFARKLNQCNCISEVFT